MVEAAATGLCHFLGDEIKQMYEMGRKNSRKLKK